VRGAVRELGFRVAQGINRATVVSPSALVATALLTHPRRGMERTELEARCAFLVRFLRRGDARFSRALEGDPTGTDAKEGLQQAIFLFHKNNYVTIHDQGELVVYSVNSDFRPSLDYYKNNLLHHIVEPALIATALLRAGGVLSLAALSQEVKELSRLLKHEFLFRADVPFEETLKQVLHKMQGAKLITVEDLSDVSKNPEVTPAEAGVHLERPGWVPGLAVGAPRTTSSSLPLHLENKGEVLSPDAQVVAIKEANQHLAFFRALLLNFLESIWIVLTSLEDLLAKPLPEKDFLKQIQLRGERLYLTGEVRRKEACVVLTYQNVIALLQDRKIITSQSLEDAKGKATKTTLSLAASFKEKSARDKLIEEVTRYLKPGE
jgi:glycerol-3-phosphate O-acyltransferase